MFSYVLARRARRELASGRRLSEAGSSMESESARIHANPGKINGWEAL